VRIASVLFLTLVLAGCQSMAAKPPEKITEYVTKLQYPQIDPELLSCAPEPIVPDGVRTDAAALAWAEDVRKAGQDCRGKVGALRDTVAKWPKSAP
jgi:PBP1b-binding outer membrane lipoprotein LpoB